MSANIVIRTAKKDYVCDCCGRIIRQGEEYLDKVILNNGTCVRHERYHDECPRDSVPERLIKRLVESGEPLPVRNLKDDVKYNLCGIELYDGNWYVKAVPWSEHKALSWDLESFMKQFVDGEGNKL